MDELAGFPSFESQGGEDELKLIDGSRIAVVGGGPAGSFTSYFLLEMADRVGLALEVDIFEPRDFSLPAPIGCNMCGGIISETLVQNLAAEGINLPPTVVQRGIDSYVLHTDIGSVRIKTPLNEKRIAAVYRGPGPRDIKIRKWQSFDHHLQKLAVGRGARLIRERVTRIELDGGLPSLAVKGQGLSSYDLLVVAVGVNSPALKLFRDLGLGYEPPRTTKTFIREYFLGEDLVGSSVGSSMHVFLLNIPRLKFAAVIPKGDYVTICLLGDEIDGDLLNEFLSYEEVQSCLPESWVAEMRSCQCSPRISIRGADRPFGDRLVFVGDCGVTRLYKDGIGAAYRTAKACATTAVFEGISANSFRRYYWPVCRSINRDNAIGRLTFLVTRLIQEQRVARRAVLRMTAKEQSRPGRARDMSQVLWDLFTGSAPYREILLRSLQPRFLSRLIWEYLASAFESRRRAGAHAGGD